MNPDPAVRDEPPRHPSRALVLGGGGALGIGWEAGLLNGLAEGGLDLSEADLIVGTSAGSLVGAHLALGDNPAAGLQTVAAFGTLIASGEEAGGPQTLWEVMRKVMDGRSPEQGRRLVGRLALEATTVPEEQFVGLLSDFGGQIWPRRYACTAIDAETGALQFWNAPANVPLARAIASSCAAPLLCPPVTIGGRRYIDGGLRTPLNADVVAGYQRVVAVSCFPLSLPACVSDPVLAAWADAQEHELDVIRESGGVVKVIVPNEAFLALSGNGTSLSGSSSAVEAYEVGVHQAELELDRIRALWGGS